MNNQDLDNFKAMQEEMRWTNRELAQFLGRSIKTIESWRGGTQAVDPLAVKALKFAVSYSRQFKARKINPSEFDNL